MQWHRVGVFCTNMSSLVAKGCHPMVKSKI